jgi:hypothetical protein
VENVRRVYLQRVAGPAAMAEEGLRQANSFYPPHWHFSILDVYLLAVLRIHDILVWIHDILVWIQIRGSMPLTNGSGSFNFYH